ncbi:class I SAM-dependent DNA methyltransferase [Fusobacterium animalis]|uniref:class I SAM-dependent DNA methyltransferase n=1 Tax=Fusobacterium animalis TaxID=76859 RepID=UPI0035573D59
MKSIESIIKKLGYANSESLIYLQNINKCADLSWHDKRILKILSPYAIYIVDKKPLVLFFDDLENREDIFFHTKVWNAQIPIIISDEGNIIKIYSGKSTNLDNKKNIRLKDIISYDIENCDENNSFSYWNITNSLSLDEYKNNINDRNLNRFLIENLRYITQKLKYKYQVSFSNKLMLRILFIRYLIDRGVNIGYLELNDNIKDSQKKFLDIVKNKEKFFKLIKYLKEKFNGNLFEIDYQQEEKEINEDVLNMLCDFLTANKEMGNAQLSLFPFYDFNIIPIELISSIYEILLGKEKKNNDKAFYTPEYLVEYIVDRTVGKYLIKNNSCKVLDPSCGSGIFLVKSLQKVLEKNINDNGYIENKNIISELVGKNIYGIDYNEESVDVTIFSIYITLFDYQDPKKLEEFKLPLLKNKNIIFGDFFDDNKIISIKDINFNFILGNPPWGHVEQKLYKQYCKNKNMSPQNGEISVAFLLKVQDIANIDTECSLIVPSKLLYKGKKPSIILRKNLLTNTQINQIMEISSLRKQIFKGAIAPATIISFNCKKNSLEHKIEYISLKPNKISNLYGIIMIEPDDIKYVKQELLLENDFLWKILVYGGYWDFELISNIFKKFDTIKKIILKYHLIMTKGLQDNDGDKKDASHFIGKKILDSNKAINHFYLNKEEYTLFDKNEIHRIRDNRIFEGPYVLFKKGIEARNYSIKAVYTEENYLYRESINSIKGTKNDKNILLNICGLLNSSLFSYFNLMLGSSVGIEREQIFLGELEKYPYSYSQKLVEMVEKIQQTNSEEAFNKIKLELDKYVIDMFGFQQEDKYFIDYATSIQIPLISGTYQEKKCDRKTLKDYINIFLNIWNRQFNGSGVYLAVNIYPNIKNKFTAIQIKFSFKIQDTLIKFVNTTDINIDLLTKFMIYKFNDHFYQTKDIIEFLEDSFIIVKPIEIKNWHPAKAVKDAYKVLNAILLEKEDCLK